MIFREIFNFLFVFLAAFVIFNLGQFLYGLFPAESFFALGVALLYAVYRFGTWLLSAGGPR